MRERRLSRVFGVLLAAGLLLSVSAPAMAAEENTAAIPCAVTASAFQDVPANSWYAEAVAYVSGKGLMRGTSAETFAPEKTLTRGMFVTILARLANVRTEYYSGDNFQDVKSGSWCFGAVTWAVDSGIVNGYTAKLFGVNRPVTREQAAVMIANAADNIFWLTLPENGTAASFADAAAISASFKDDVELMGKTGILQGDAKGNFNPKRELTRGEAASVFMRLSQAVEAVGAAADKSARTLTASGAACTVRERVLLRDLRSDIRYPEISGLASAENQKAWNAVFLKNAEAEKKAVAEEGGVIQDTFAVSQADEKLLSVTESSYAYMDGGMHGTSALFTWNFDMATGKQVGLSDLCDTGAMAKAIVSGKGYEILTSWGETAESNGLYLSDILTMNGCEKTQTAVKALLDRFDNVNPDQISGRTYWENGKPCLVLSVCHAAGDYCVIRMDGAYSKTA